MAAIPLVGHCIDRYEASAGKGDKGAPDGKNTSLHARSVAGKLPIVEVSHAQAEAACRNVGKRLCTDEEWLAACRGKERWQYPYGNAFEPRRCQDWNESGSGTKGVAATGSHATCVTPQGVFDLANNAGEYTSTPGRLGKWTVRGGTYNMTIHDSACDEDDYLVELSNQSSDVGFRCCTEPPP